MAGGEALLVQVCRQGGEQMVEHRIGPRLRSRQVGGHGRIDLDGALIQQGLLLAGIPNSLRTEKLSHAKQGLEAPSILDLLAGAIAAGVIGGGGVASKGSA